jgi:putative alpha-1,2-mannosidase
MRRLLFAALLAGACGGDDASPPRELPPVDNVDPFIGSGGFGFGSGSSFPGAAAPHGLCKVGPDTQGEFGTLNFLHYAGYWYGDDTVRGFSHLHLHGTGATDYGVVALMPTPDGAPSTFDKASETSRPGYYALTLDEGGVRVEITATAHAAHHRYTGAAAVKLDLDHHLEDGAVEGIEVAPDADGQGFSGRLRSIGGMSGGFGGYDVFFVARAQPAFTATPVADGLLLDFGAPAGLVEIRLGVSLVDAAGALANLEAEIPDFTFEDTRAATEAAWAELIGRVRVSGGTPAERRIFYSALYRAFLMPTWVGDVDGRWRAPDGTIAVASGWRPMSDLSLWDTYRTLHPLYAVAWPESAADSVRSLHEFARVAGFFPKWPIATGESGTMVGASAEVVVADAVVKGAAGALDAEDAYRILRAAALDEAAPPGGRGGRREIESYLATGWLPATVDGSVSKTVEFAQDDAALAELAGALGHDADRDALAARSRGWRELFDPASGFLRARYIDGSFAMPFDPLDFTDAYVEANAWQSSFPAHDAAELALAFGGEEALVAQLEELFVQARAEWDSADPRSLGFQAVPRSYYWHGNEPDLHAAWLFARAGRPDLTDTWVRWVMDAHYRDEPDGLPGNDDGGTLSAWWVFAALGLYPIAGTPAYVLSAPRFSRAEIDVPGGVFTIVAEGEGDRIQAIDLDGVPRSGRDFFHAELRPGSVLRFVRGR